MAEEAEGQKIAQSREVPFLTREGYLEVLAREITGADTDKIKELYDAKLGEVTNGGGMFVLGGPSQLRRAAYIRASAELNEAPKLYQASDTKTNETP